MKLQDPVLAHIAETNIDAMMVHNALINAGIAAHVVEDVSPVGVYSLGLASQLHKPEVWVERHQLEEAVRLVAQHEEHRLQDLVATDFCYACGETLSAEVERCPMCGAAIERDETDGQTTKSAQASGADHAPAIGSRSMSMMRGWKRPLATIMVAATIGYFLSQLVLEFVRR